MKRGDIVLVSVAGDFGKPRPAIVVRSSAFVRNQSVTVCLLTSTLREAPFLRVDIAAVPSTGLRAASQIMVDKVMTLRTEKVSGPVGAAPADVMAELNIRLGHYLGLQPWS